MSDSQPGTLIWQKAFSYLMANEGQTYVEDPSPTLRGITVETLSAWRKKACTASDIRSLTLAETVQIYKALYWDKIKADQLQSEPVVTAFFDAAVNVGVPTAARAVQTIVGALPDGVIGPKSVAAINAYGADALVTLLSMRQQAFYVSLVRAKASRKKYLKTWLRRSALYQDLLV